MTTEKYNLFNNYFEELFGFRLTAFSIVEMKKQIEFFVEQKC